MIRQDAVSDELHFISLEPAAEYVEKGPVVQRPNEEWHASYTSIDDVEVRSTQRLANSSSHGGNVE